MDVSAFEADAAGDLTWEDLVPDGMRGPIKHGARIFARFGGLLVFMITFAGCAIAFVVMLLWIVQYWILTKLLLATAGLLRTVYDEPPGPDYKAKPNDSLDDKPGSDSDGSKTDKPVITAADLDQFESYLSSTDTPSRQNETVSAIDLREAALQRILQQEKELDAEIQEQSQTEHRSALLATRSSLTLQEKGEQKKVAEQDAWLARLISHKGSKSSSTPSGVIEGTRSNADPETRSNHFNSAYNAEQLAEAANFAKTATRGRSSVRSTVRGLHTPKPQRTTHLGNAMINANSNMSALDPRRVAQSNFKFTDSPGALPPHLKKLNAAKAARLNDSVPSSPLGDSDLADGKNLERRKVEVTNVLAVAEDPKDTNAGYTELENRPTRISSQSEVVEEVRRHDSGSEPSHATLETTPLVTNRGGGGMSIDALKALNPNSAPGQRRQRLPGSFIAAIERSVRLIAGEENKQSTILSDGRIVKKEATQVRTLHDDYHSYGEEDKLGQPERSNIEQSPSQDQTLGQDFHHQTEPTDDALGGAATSQSEALSQPGQLRNDRDEDEQKRADQGDEDSSRLCDLPFADDEVATMASPQLPTSLNRISLGETMSRELAERRTFLKEMPNLSNKSIEKNSTSATPTTSEKKPFITGSATENAVAHSGSHELDLVGLDFSAGMTSPADPVSTTKPQLQASSQEFVPGTTFLRDVEEQRLQNEKQERLDARLAQSQAARRLRKEREAEAVGAAMIAPKQPEQTFMVPEHSYWPDPFSGSAFSLSPSANTMPMQHHSASYPTSSFFTPLGSSEHVWQAALPQPEPHMSFPTAGYNTLALGGSPFHLSTSEPSQYLPSAPPAQAHTKRASITNKAVAIKKPPEVKYDEDFPQLPAGTSSLSNVNVQPPPGLSSSNGSPQNTFDALLSDTAVGKGPGVATSNPFDALLQKGNNTELRLKATSNEDSHNTQGQATGVESDAASKATHKKRKQARTDCARAWVERESIRKRVVGTYTLDGMRALEYASKTYNDLRSHLASVMASGELREEDAKMFEYFSTSDLRVPATSVGSIRKLIPDDKMALSSATIGKTGAIQGMKQENKAPKRSDEEINELYKKAINARNVYAESHAYFTRPPPRGRSSVKDLRAQGEARVERAARYYAQAREALAAAYGGALPAETKEKLWVYDDYAMKKNRDSWMP